MRIDHRPVWVRRTSEECDDALLNIRVYFGDLDRKNVDDAWGDVPVIQILKISVAADRLCKRN